MNTTEHFQAWLKRRRLEAKLTYKTLAAAAKVSTAAIHAIEHGSSSPSLDTVEKLCGALGTSVEAAVRVRASKAAVKPVDATAGQQLLGD